MKRKIYKLCLFVIALATMVGCRQVPFAEYSTMADWTWVYSNTAAGDYSNAQVDPLYMKQYTDLSMMDCSQGFISHQWIVDEGVGIYFLSEDLDTDDGPQIVANASYVTSEPTIHLYFDEWREEPYEVRLLNTYNKMVSYNYQLSSVDYTSYSTYQDGVYVADTTFRIRVFASTMNPMARVFRERVEVGNEKDLSGALVYTSDSYSYADEILTKDGDPLPFNDDGTAIDASLWTAVEVGFGKSLYFLDVSTDTPSSRTWTNTKLGSFSSTDEECEMVFNLTTTAAGNVTYNAITLNSQRAAEDNMPSATGKTVTLPLSITVVDSSDPYSVSFQQEGSGIRMSLSGAAFSSDIANYGDYFTIGYTNNFEDLNGTGHKTDDTDGTIDACTVTYDSSSPASILISPSSTDDPIYNTDELSVVWSESLPLMYHSDGILASGSSDNEGYGGVTSSLVNLQVFYDFDNYYDENGNVQTYTLGADTERSDWVYINGPSGSTTSGAIRVVQYDSDAGDYTAITGPQPYITVDPYKATGVTENTKTLDSQKDNNVLCIEHYELYAPLNSSTSGYSNNAAPHLIAGARFPGINTKGGTYTMSMNMYLEDNSEYKCLSNGTTTSINVYGVPYANATIDPDTDTWEYTYAYTTTDAWMYNVDRYTWWYNWNGSKGAWKVGSNALLTGTFDSVAPAGDESDWVFFSFSLYNFRAKIYIDNFIVRNVELRPTKAGKIGYYGTYVDEADYQTYFGRTN